MAAARFGRRRCPDAGGLMRGSVVAWPQRKQMRALSAISVPQFVQIIA
jgi:hypothetical protein